MFIFVETRKDGSVPIYDIIWRLRPLDHRGSQTATFVLQNEKLGKQPQKLSFSPALGPSLKNERSHYQEISC